MARGAHRGPGGGLDPSVALTVGEAGRLAGVSEAALRKRIQSGRLLHEVGRRAGREVQLIRLVDLAELYPLAAESLTQRSATPEPLSGERSTSTAAELHPEARADAASGSTVHSRDSLELRFATLQSDNQGLTERLNDLQQQRSYLVEQHQDLRDRLNMVEQERQAGSAGLFLTQKRLLDLDAVAPMPPRRWWREGSTWFTASVALLAVFLVRLELSETRAAVNDTQGRLDQSLAWEREDRGQMQQQLGDIQRSSQALSASVQEERARGERERGAFDVQLSDSMHAAGELRAALKAEFEDAQVQRREWSAALGHERELSRRREEELRQVREAASLERDRYDLWLADAAAAERKERDEHEGELRALEARAAREQADTQRLLVELRAELEGARLTIRGLSSEVQQLVSRQVLDQGRLHLALQRLDEFLSPPGPPQARSGGPFQLLGEWWSRIGVRPREAAARLRGGGTDGPGGPTPDSVPDRRP